MTTGTFTPKVPPQAGQMQESTPALAGRKPRALMCVQSAMWALDLNEDEVLRLIDDGQLLWAFDISSPGARCRDIRILSDSVAAIMQGRPVAALNETSIQEAWVVSRIFPAAEFVKVKEVARILSCSSTHVFHLVHSGAVQAEPTSWASRRSGPKGSPVIYTQSLQRWLLKRRVV